MSKRREGPEALASLPGTLTESAEIRPPSHLSRRSQADYRALTRRTSSRLTNA